MPKFEMFIPHSAAGFPDMTLRIDAENWMFALQAGRRKLGEQGDLGSNIMCDFKDDGSVHVSDPTTGRVFRILELQAVPEPQPQAAPPAAPAPQPQAAPAPQPVAAPVVVAPAPAPQPKPQAAPPAAPAPQPQAAPAPVAPAPAPQPQPQPAPAAKPMPKPVPIEQKTAPKTSPRPVMAPMAPVQAKVEVAAAPAVAPKGPIGRQEKEGNIEEELTDIFQSVMDLWSTCKTKEDVANFMLDLALRKLSAESGAIFFSDIAGGDLKFLAARGPKAKDVMRYTVPMGQGIVGFCAQSGVSVAIADVHKDPRWYSIISKNTGYETKSILCSVIQYDGQSLGALELVNKNKGATFTLDELNVLNYIAHEAGDALARMLDQEFVAKNKKK